MPDINKNDINDEFNNENNAPITWDGTLRPKTLGDYIGQEKLKENLRIFIDAAKKRDEPLEHILLHGSAGLGKTTLAHIIAKEMGSNIRVTSGPAIERAGDLAAIFTNLEDGDILFIDEIHRINKNIEEVMYPAMEDYMLDIIVGKGPSARTLRLNLPRFTLIGATTKVSNLSSPLRDRFGAIYKLNFYDEDEISNIVTRSANLLDIKASKGAVSIIASRARKTPRIANRILKRVRDFAQVHDKPKLSEDDCHNALSLMDIDHAGLDEVDRTILETLVSNFDGGPAGLNSLAATLGEEMATLEEIHEPFLLQLGFIERTPRGRIITRAGKEHINTPNTQKGLL